MKKLTRREREMSREAFDHIGWTIENVKKGIARREAGLADSRDLVELRERLERLERLAAAAIITCETDDEADIMAENSYN